MLAAVQLPASQPSLTPASTSPANAGAAGSSSFSHLLSAADAQRNAEEAPAAPASTAAAPGQRAAGTRAAAADDAAANPAGGEDAAADTPTDPDATATDAAAWLAGLAGLTLPAQPAAAAATASAATTAAAGDTAHPVQDQGRGGKPERTGALLAAVRDAGKTTPGAPTTDAPGSAGAALAKLAAPAADEARAAAPAAPQPTLAAARASTADAGLPPVADDALATDARAADAAAVAPAPAADATGLPAALPGAPGAAATGATTATALPTAEARLNTPPGSPEFAHQLGAQLTTFVRGGVQHARLELHPLELGPVTVRIELSGRHAQVNLVAEHALTRQALEQALPALAGSLREAGLTLSGGGVSDQPRQPQPDAQTAAPGARTAGSAGRSESAAAPVAAVPRRRGVVDLMA